MRHQRAYLGSSRQCSRRIPARMMSASTAVLFNVRGLVEQHRLIHAQHPRQTA
jgi:hypothetical protein